MTYYLIFPILIIVLVKLWCVYFWFAIFLLNKFLRLICAGVFYLIFSWSTVMGFPGDSDGKESTCNAGDPGSIPGSERSAGEGNGCPLQNSGLENSMDCVVRGVAKSRTRLSSFHFHFSEGQIARVSAFPETGDSLQEGLLTDPWIWLQWTSRTTTKKKRNWGHRVQGGEEHTWAHLPVRWHFKSLGKTFIPSG